MKTVSRKCQIVIIIALAAYIIKNLFVGADSDEGYGIVLGYRLAMGDKLFWEMWEPHQTSAIFTVLFIKPFLWLTGDVEFLNIYLRMVYFLIHGVITAFVYRTLQTCIFQGEKKKALWLALLFFVSSPKCIYIPEYSNLHIWFFTLLCLSFLWYDCEDSPLKGKQTMLVAAGFFLACDILAYPSMVILFPVFLILIWHRHAGKRSLAAFAGPCLLVGGALLCYVLSYMTVEQILRVIPYILSDGSHQAGFWDKILGWISGFGEIALIICLTGSIAGILTAAYSLLAHKKINRVPCFLMIFYLLQIIHQFYCWFASRYNASYPHTIYLFITLTGIFCYRRGKIKEKSGLYFILFSCVNYLGVMFLSNWEPVHLMPYLILGALGGLIYWDDYLSGQLTAWKGKVIPVLSGILVLANVFGYCWLFIGGEEIHSSLLTVGGINRTGLRKGTFTSYMQAYRYNDDIKIWTEAVPEGSTCLYIGALQYYYMFGDCKISAPSTISTPVYNERMLTYWEMHPDRYPDVVVVESWFGDMRAAQEGSFIREWLENEFQASQITDYSYVTVYRK